jgi:TolB protein
MAMKTLIKPVWQGLLVLLIAAVPMTALAQGREEPHIVIDQGQVAPLPIAVPAFTGEGTEEARFGEDIANVISANLERSGLFAPADPRSFIERSIEFGAAPQFGSWRLIRVDALINGRVVMQDDGRLRVEFFLWDVYGEQSMLGLQFFSTPEGWRRVAHLISDAVYERLTGESGYFDTRIVFIAESGPATARVKRLAIMDQDGANPIMLTDGRDLVLTPRFSPTEQEVVFLSYFNNTPRVYLFNIESGEQEVVGDFPGMTFAPRFSPDGNEIIMSLIEGRDSHIYTMDLRTGQRRRLTSGPDLNTAPCFSPDGRFITFESDRGGSQQIYVMNRDGSNAHRISFGQGRYGTPVWSPRGDLIAFTKIYNGRFYIGVMRPDGSGERLLTESFLDEGPTWSPNGRVLMFTRQTPGAGGRGGSTRIWSVDLTGYNERPILTPGDASDPAWSPLISRMPWAQ